MKRVAATCAFTTEDLSAVAYVTGIEEPSPHDLKRFMLRAVNRAIADARAKADARDVAEEADVSF